MNRRHFIRIAGAVGSGLALDIERAFAAETDHPPGGAAAGTTGPHTLDVPDTGWRMWRDPDAPWQDDKIFLPDEVKLAELPIRPPTGGWAALGGTAGREVALPATVEQFYWGETGFRPYKDEYRFETADDQVKNGAYYGVSWWWRSLEIPAECIGRRILLHVRGARQRAEVFLNQKLVGYSIMEELSFECDLTSAARGGVNELAIRITNPGGRLDWRDGSRLNWAGLQFHKSHGFGGLDRGLTLSVHGPVRVSDAWVLNTSEPRTITAHAEVENSSGEARSGTVRFAVVDPANGRELAATEVPVTTPSGGTTRCFAQIAAAGAELWDLTTPRLYRLQATWKSGPDSVADTRETEFGFRWFAVEGLGQDALFRLNGRRIRLYTSISWGYWALNGLFPTPELAEKEVQAAKAFNLNCLNFHRNLPKEDVLRIHDREGVLRCLEPGGGSQAIVPRDRTAGFADRYMREKILRMIRAFRSHPSVVHYIIQNEASLDTSNPSLHELFAAMRAEDPSRSIVGSDGFVMRSPQAWQAAYSDEVRRSDKPATLAGGAAGWWVDHSGHSTDVWQDGCYLSPRDYFYQSPNRAEIVEWGEMKGPSSSDDHGAVLEQIRRHGGASYDRLDHEEILAAYNAFLDRWGFRKAFPSASDLFRSIGRRAYESWGQFMENIRINDETDMAVISGWESTAIEDHSGLVDNFRDFKADPRAIAESLTPLRPVAKQRQLVLGVGEPAVFDLYLLNDTNGSVSGDLRFALLDPDGRVAQEEHYPAPTFERDRLSYLVHEALTTAALSKAGRWKTRFELVGSPAVTHEREILVVDIPTPQTKSLIVALADVSGPIADLLAGLPTVTTMPFEEGKSCDVVVFGGRTNSSPQLPGVTADGADQLRATTREAGLPEAVFAAVRAGTPLLAVPSNEGYAQAVARQLAEAGAFRYDGMVGQSRASWMGAWYFVREHPLYDGMPVNQSMGLHYQVKSGGGNGWRVEGENVEIVAGYGRDHDRNLGAGTLTAKLGNTRLVLHQILGMHPMLQRRFLLNAVQYLTAKGGLS